VSSAFRGSPEALVVRLLDDPGLSDEELSRIRKLIAKRKK
jgi:hypothetical protein